ncbi:MAG: transcriptional repressor [Clostridia bacterium]|nr:transcriptional repressor [Clostridia bacterium]
MKYSRQREQILEFVKSVRTHPTAETVYQEVRKKNPKISLGTVYRNLVFLSEQGDINRIKIADGKDRFDYDTSHHYHAICTKCGKITDAKIDYLGDIDKKVSQVLDLEILSHDIIFNTICKDCNK